MAKTEKSVTELKINKLTKAQYDEIISPSDTELYFVTDEPIDYNDLTNTPDFADVALSGDYDDLINKPFIPAAQVNSDWNATSGVAQILNKPNLATVATSGDYDDLINKPSITNDIIPESTSLLTSGGAYSNLVSNITTGDTENKINITKAGTTSTITIDNVENATVSSKLGTTSIGTSIKPIYLQNGVATPINYTIAASVPANAKFTDTTYSVFTGATPSTDGTAGLVKKPLLGEQNKFLKADGTWSLVDSFPSQSGQSGKYLTTNGSTVSWDALADVANSGDYNDLINKPINVSSFTNDAGYITSEYHDNTKQDTLIAGTNISIAADGKTISATDTTYTAGNNISIENNVINATDTKYTAGENITISGNTISATDTTYSTGTKNTPGITKLYTDLGKNTDGALTQSAASSKLVNYNTVNQELNAFGGTSKMYWLSSVHNAFYKADQRFNVSWTGFSSGSLDTLFNGSFENHSNIIANGDIGKVTISRTGTSGGITGGYTQGFVYLSFYYNRAPINLSQITVKYIPRAGGDPATATMEEVHRSTVNGVSYIQVAKCRIPNVGAQLLEITIDNTDGTTETNPDGISLNEIEFFETRPNGIQDFPIVTKYTDSEIYGKLTATSFIKKGGTSSQFLKADGSVDNNTYVTSTQLNNKQDKLIASTNIQIASDGKTISATDTKYSAGNGLTLTGTTFSANVIDNATSDSTIDALSARVGKVLQEQINNLNTRGKYLSIWDCTTGLAMDTPPVDPYTYETGSYYIVGPTGTTNYRPTGSTYSSSTPSRVVETNIVKSNDTYYYDGTTWRLLTTPEVSASFANLAGNPEDNTNLKNALDAKTDDNTLATVAKTGSYNDLDDTPTIPAAQVNSDWNATSGIAQILNKPTLATVATSGSYNDLNDAPSVPIKVSELTNDVNYQTDTQVAASISTHNTSNSAHSSLFNTKANDTDVVHKAGAETISGVKTFAADTIQNVGTYRRFAMSSERRFGALNSKPAYTNWTDEQKSTCHRIWRISFPTGANFWGKIYIGINGQYSSFNASGFMSKEINLAFNTSLLYNNVGRYLELGGNIEKDFRISEAIWNSTTSCWEILIYSHQPQGNNAPSHIVLKCETNNESYMTFFNSITVNSTCELSTDTQYINQRGRFDGSSITKLWADTPTYQDPYGYNIYSEYNHDSTKQDKLVSGTNIKTINSQSIVGSGNLTLDGLPSQSGQSGKYLTTNGTTASWNSVSYNNLSNKLTAGTDINISASNVVSCTYPEVYISEEDYQDLVETGTVDPNTYYNTDDATQMTVTDFITKKDSMNPGDQLPQGYLVFVEVQ